MNHEDFKKALADNPNTKFKFDLNKVIYTFKCYPEVTGVITFVAWMTDGHFLGEVEGYGDSLSFKPENVEIYKEDTEATKLQFPCCVATSEIKDRETFQKILDLFVANGAEVSDRLFSFKENWNWFGVDVNDLSTQYYNSVGSYAMDYEENDVTVYTLEQLLAFLPKEEVPVAQVTALLPIGTEVKIAETSRYYGVYPDSSNPKDTKGTVIELDEDDDEFCYTVRWENGKRNSYGLNDLVRWEETPSVASQEAITERLEDNPSVGIDYSVMGSTASVDPLITITQEVKYTVVIKGITFTFTQEEIDGLAEELLGFTTL